MLFKFVEQRIQLQRRKMVSVRVRQYCPAARSPDPPDRVPEAGPLLGDVARFSSTQVLLECSPSVGGVTLFNEEASEVAAAQDACICSKPGGTSQRIRDTRGAELLRDECGTSAARHAICCQTLGEPCVAGIDTESDHMHCQSCPSDRNLDSRHETDAGLASRRFRFRQPTHFVMVGEREHRDPVVKRASDQRCGSQQSIGIRGVAV